MFFYNTLFALNIFINLALGILVYSYDKKNINKIFFLLILCVLQWTTSIYFLWSADTSSKAFLWGKLSFIGSTLVPVLLIYFFYYFPKPAKKIVFKSLFLLFTGPLLIYIALFNNLIISGAKIEDWGVKIILGKLFIFFPIYFLIYLFYSLYIFWIQYKKSSGLETIQIKYLLFGFFLTATCALFTNILLPIFNINQFVGYGPLATVFFALFTAYAITKHQLFNIKVIATELLVGIMVIMLFFLILLMPSGSLKILTSIVLGLFLIFGFLLIKATHAEVRRKEEAERLLKAKTEFLSIASHQLRTPLTAIIGYSSMLKEGDYGRLPKGASEAIKHINDSSQRMIKLVNDFLSVSRLETGRTVLKKRDFSLNELIEQVVSGLKLKAKEKNLYLEYEKQKNDKIIKMDPEKLKEAISNLIDNSIHYTERGGITVSSKTTNSKIIITISDTGVGMSRQEISALFESFSRGKAGNELNTQGSGLGLYIAKKFVEMHNGRIWAESEGKDKGSFFHIEIPNK